MASSPAVPLTGNPSRDKDTLQTLSKGIEAEALRILHTPPTPGEVLLLTAMANLMADPKERSATSVGNLLASDAVLHAVATADALAFAQVMTKNASFSRVSQIGSQVMTRPVTGAQDMAAILFAEAAAIAGVLGQPMTVTNKGVAAGTMTSQGTTGPGGTLPSTAGTAAPPAAGLSTGGKVAVGLGALAVVLGAVAFGTSLLRRGD